MQLQNDSLLTTAILKHHAGGTFSLNIRELLNILDVLRRIFFFFCKMNPQLAP